MKKIVSILCLLVLVVSIVVGCSPSYEGNYVKATEQDAEQLEYIMEQSEVNSSDFTFDIALNVDVVVTEKLYQGDKSNTTKTVTTSSGKMDVDYEMFYQTVVMSVDGYDERTSTTLRQNGDYELWLTKENVLLNVRKGGTIGLPSGKYNIDISLIESVISGSDFLPGDDQFDVILNGYTELKRDGNKYLICGNINFSPMEQVTLDLDVELYILTDGNNVTSILEKLSGSTEIEVDGVTMTVSLNGTAEIIFKEQNIKFPSDSAFYVPVQD